MNKCRKYTRQILEEAAKESNSVTDVMRNCGIERLTGSMHALISRRLKEHEIDTRHFTGKKFRLGKPFPNKRSGLELLVKRNDGMRTSSDTLTRALLFIGREYKCFECGLSEWRRKRIVLQIEHKDGDFQNSLPENIEFICPNCHSQTPTFSRPKNSRIKEDKKKRIKAIKTTRHPSLDGYWRTKDKPHLRKVTRPSVDALHSLLQFMPIVKIGAKFGVSDNAVRKWVKRYGLEMPTKFGRSRIKVLLT